MNNHRLSQKDEPKPEQRNVINGLRREGYTDLCVKNGMVCGLKRSVVFGGQATIYVNMEDLDNTRTYPRKSYTEARADLELWDGTGDP